LCPVGDKKEFGASGFRQGILEVFPKYICLLDKLSVGFPIWACLSLLSVKQYSLSAGTNLRPREYPLDRDELITPEVQVEQPQVSVKEILKAAFDVIGNACGMNEFPGSRE